MSTPRVAVLLPTRNAAPFVERTLRALGAQDHPQLEILISDDASEDATARLCERFAASAPRVRLYRQPSRLGWVENVNFLLGRAQAEYVMLACHDDLVDRSYVSKLAALLVSRPTAVLAYSDGVIENYDGSRSDWRCAALDLARTRLARALVIVRQTPNWPIAYHGLVRADAARRVGGLRRHGGGEFAADLPWLLHLSLLGEIVRVAEPLLFKVCLASGLANSWRYDLHNQWSAILSCAREVRRAQPPPHERAVLYAELARRAARLGVRSARHALRTV